MNIQKEIQKRIRRTGMETTEAILRTMGKALLKTNVVDMKNDPAFKEAAEEVGAYLHISPRTVVLQIGHVNALIEGKMWSKKHGIDKRSHDFLLGAIRAGALTNEQGRLALETIHNS